MKILFSAIMVVILLSGCSTFEDTYLTAADLRRQILEAEECKFDAVITADYVDEIYEFQMNCISDNTGKIIFEVTAPTSIAGITGTLSEEGGALTFDDAVLAFPMLTQLELTPVSAPWLFLNSLRSGYITGCSHENGEYTIYIDDSFEEDPLSVQIKISGDSTPYYAEIIWKERRILTLHLKNFEIV